MPPPVGSARAACSSTAPCTARQSRTASTGGSLTSGFLHVGFFHLATNMFSLYILGQLLEPAAGHVRFAAIYFVSLLTGSFGALVVTAGPTVGASGAIFGLMAAAALVLRSRGIGIMESGLGIWIGLNLLITFAVPGISVGGHIGGLIGGAVSAYVLFDLRQRLRVPDALPRGVLRAGRRARGGRVDHGVLGGLGPHAREVDLDRAPRVRRRHEVGVQQVRHQLHAVHQARAGPGEVGRGVHRNHAGAERDQLVPVA